MALSDAALVLAATAIKNAITHVQVHSAAPNGSGVGSEIGGRIALPAGSVDADGDISWANVAATGLGANATIWGVTYWSASSAGTFYGSRPKDAGGDSTANAAGEYTFTSIVENGTAS